MNTEILGTSIPVITVRSGNTLSWATLSWVEFTRLVQDARSCIGTLDSSVFRESINVIFLPLSVVETITDGPVRPSFVTWARTEGNLISSTIFFPFSSIGPLADDPFTDRFGGDFKGNNVCSSSSFSGTVTWSGHVSSNAVHVWCSDTRKRIVDQLRTRGTSTGWIDSDGSVSGLVSFSAHWALDDRGIPRVPLTNFTGNRTTSSITSLILVSRGGTWGTTILVGLIDGSGSELSSISTGDSTSGPGSPFSIGTWDWWTFRSVRNVTDSRSRITVVFLTSISEGRTVDRSVDTSSSTTVSRSITSGDGTEIRRWARNVHWFWCVSASNSLIAISVVTDVVFWASNSLGPVTVQFTRRSDHDTKIFGTSQLVVTLFSSLTWRSNVGTWGCWSTVSCGGVVSIGSTSFSTIGRSLVNVVTLGLESTVTITFGPVGQFFNTWSSTLGVHHSCCARFSEDVSIFPGTVGPSSKSGLGNNEGNVDESRKTIRLANTSGRSLIGSTAVLWLTWANFGLEGFGWTNRTTTARVSSHGSRSSSVSGRALSAGSPGRPAVHDTVNRTTLGVTSNRLRG